MKYCSDCGKELTEGVEFCPNCGASVNGKIKNNNVSQNKKKDLAIPGFVCSIIGFICCTYVAIPGLILSIMSLMDIKSGKASRKNMGLAIAGIILGVLGIIVMINNIVNPNPDVSEAMEELFNA